MKYQNTLQNGNKAAFIETELFNGNELTFVAKATTASVGGQVVKFAKASIALRTPKDITACGTPEGCTVGTVTQSFKLDFNILDEASLDVLQAEVLRVLALTKESLAHGILPPQYSTFGTA